MEQFEPIAIVGIAGRFPLCRTLSDFWSAILDGRSLLTRYSLGELIAAGINSEIAQSSTYVPVYGALNAPLLFANERFGYSSAEATIINPQQRIFLELCWEALFDAGMELNANGVNVGVFAACSENTYRTSLMSEGSKFTTLSSQLQLDFGNEKDFVSLRVSYDLNLTGPSVSIGSACSSSLAAVHLACQSLHARDCAWALAGGVSVRHFSPQGYRYEDGGILAKDGNCRPFDSRASGTVFGDGGGVVLLQRLSDAQRDNSKIYGVIRGSALNNDGAAKVGFAAPSATAQVALIRQALERARLTPDQINYIEAHGTGTAIGDPIEAMGLSEVFSGQSRQICTVGSLKGNCGHLDSAAGIASLIKAVLISTHRTIPPLAGFQSLSPHIDFQGTRLRILYGSSEPHLDGTFRIGVSSFGMGGTNAHVILESYDSEKRAVPLGPRNTPAAIRHSFPRYHSRAAHPAACFQRRWVSIDDCLEGSKIGPIAVTVLIKHTEDRQSTCSIFQGSTAVCANSTLRKVPQELGKLLSKQPSARIRVIYIDASTSSDTISERLACFVEAFRESASWFHSVEFDLITTNAYEGKLADSGVCIPAGISGALEYPSVHFRSIDLSDSLSSEDILHLVSTDSPCGGSLLRYAQGRWLELRCEPVNLLGCSKINKESKGCFIVLGGFGEIGAFIADFLLEETNAYVVIASRRASMFTSYCDEIQGTPLVRRLFGHNGRLVQSFCNLLDYESIVTLIRGCEDQFGKILGVIHAAGVSGEESYQFVRDFVTVTAQDIIAPKVQGATYLQKALEHRTDVKCLLLSSLTSLLGGVGLAAYSSANFFLDRFCELRRAEGLPWTALGLDHWESTSGKERQEFGGIARSSERLDRQSLIPILETFIGSELPPHLFLATTSSSKRLEKSPTPKVSKPLPEAGLGDLELTISTIWSDVLGMPHVDNSSNFFELGGDSVAALDFLARVTEALNVSVSFADFFQSPTLESIQQIVHRKKATLSDVPPKTQSKLILTPKESELPILFLVHPHGGGALCYTDLAEDLRSTCSISAFQARGLTAGEPPRTSVQEMAQAYCDELRGDHSEGVPYFVGGYSAGGVIAFEMARCLSLRGQPPSGLILIDTASPARLRAESDYEVFDEITFLSEIFMGRISLHTAPIRNLSLEEQRRHVIKQWQMAGLVSQQFSVESLNPLRNTFFAHLRALLDYSPEPCQVPILHIRCAQQADARTLPNSNDNWSSLCTSDYQAMEVDCSHDQILLDPHRRHVARLIAQYISNF